MRGGGGDGADDAQVSQSQQALSTSPTVTYTGWNVAADSNLGVVVLSFTFLYLLMCLYFGRPSKHFDLSNNVAVVAIFLTLILHNVWNTVMLARNTSSAQHSTSVIAAAGTSLLGILLGGLLAVIYTEMVHSWGVPQLLFFNSTNAGASSDGDTCDISSSA
jgi:hypothetical protein